MLKKANTSEQIIHKLREAEVLLSRGKRYRNSLKKDRHQYDLAS